MDSKKLAQLIKVIVEAEVAKKQEQFLSKTFPKILEEEVNRRVNLTLKEIKGGVQTPTKKIVEEDVDPFKLAESLLQKDRQVQTTQQKQYTKNTTINEILNQTQPFTSAQRQGTGGFGGGSSVLDRFQQPIQEATSYVPSYMDAEPDIDETMNFSSINGQAGVESMRAQMAAKMGYGDINPSGANRGGLGVTTGLAGLDRILNRDNSELVKKFKK